MPKVRNSGILHTIHLVLIAAVLCQFAYGKVIYVDEGASGANYGTSWANGYWCMQNALADAQYGDEIRVAQGIYKPDQIVLITRRELRLESSGDRTATFQLKNGVIIKGGFAGFGEPDPDARNIELYETILSGDLNGDDGPDFANNAENSYHVVIGSGTNETAVLEGVTITGGNANSSSPNDKGSGMHNDTGSPTVLNCTFIENSATTGGGMSNSRNSDPTVNDCTFSRNRVNNNGGGMRNNNSNPTVISCKFIGNSANNGGGMNNRTSSPSVTNCTFTGNTAKNNGGGMRNSHDSYPNITNCTFSRNSANSGGGTHNSNNGSPKVTNCIFWDDMSQEIYTTDGTPVITYCDVQGGCPGVGNIDADPLFVDIDGADGEIGTEDDDLRLLPGSPCIDAGDNSEVQASVDVDLDGNLRITNDIVDMGAYENNSSSTLSVYYVDVDADGTNDGSSWADAYNCLQEALVEAEAAEKPVEIRVAQGTYKPDQAAVLTRREHEVRGSGDRTASFNLINGVALKGGYAGFGEPDPDARNIEMYRTVLSGDLKGDDRPNFTNNSDNSYHILTGTGTNTASVLDGFTVSGGNADGPDPYDRGSGMLNSRSSPIVINCTFTANYSDSGGAMYNDNSTPKITNCTFSANSADKGGGAMNNWQSSPTLTNCMFSNNSAGWGGGAIVNVSWDEYTESSPIVTNCTFINNSAGWDGGGMSNVSSHPTLINCIFKENSAYEGGGGMHNDDGNPTLLNCTFGGNSVDKDGGAMNNYSSNPTLTNCTFSRNSANWHGGGMSNHNSSSPTLTDCTFSGNSADNGGGGMVNYSSSPTLTNCTFKNNSAGWDGGGMENRSSHPTLINCVFSENYAYEGGGGMHNGEENPTLLNCTFSGNTTDKSGGAMNNYSSSPTVANCIFSGNSAGREGGGIDNREASRPTLLNCTFSCNIAVQAGGGISNFQDSQPVLVNCILWKNSDESGTGAYSSQIQGQSVVSYSCVQNSLVRYSWPGESNINVNPCFVDADGIDNVVGTEDDDLRLLPGSPCIDSGDNSAIPQSVVTDLDGNPRIINGIVDMGAHEFGSSPPESSTDPLAEALDSTLSFTTGVEEAWFSQSETHYYDGDAAQSGPITDDQESWLQTTVDGTGTVSFYWKVSSEGNCDYLEFYIDDARQVRISDLEDWHDMTYGIPGSSSHTLKWQYVKDRTVSEGDDCGWVDKVVWTSGP